MLDILYKAMVFVLVLGALVAFHEFGHFWTARRLGVKVLRFSVGFGKPLLRYQKSPAHPEYVLASIPLGGYVKMLDEHEGTVKPEEQHLAFNRQPLWRRTLIVAAGPAANLLLAVLFYAATFFVGLNALQAVIHEPAESTPAAQAGLEGGDVIVALNGREVPSWQDLRLRLIDESIGQETLPIEIRRGEEFIRTSLPLTDDMLQAEGDPLAPLGLALWEPSIDARVGRVVDDSPAARAGLQEGDWIRAVDGRAIADWKALVDVLQARPGQTTRLAIERQGERFELALTPESVELESGESVGRIGIAPQVEGDPYAAYRTKLRHGLATSLTQGVLKTWEMSLFTLKMMGQMIVGNASLKNISGPLTIADLAGEFARYGVVPLLQFMAVISLSLGVLNLLPVPVLDGGHLVYYAIEAVKGSPLSERALIVGQQVGLVLLASLMVVAFYNDLSRIFG
ncbi:RIP metalloprotease RseP [gamma proteobacterium HTCC5015]|nr:RIP metalloprotease RseP [gamma proteobacterium HTCC5015]